VDVATVAQCRVRRLEGVPLSPEFGQEREADVRVGQRRAPQQSAQPHRQARSARFDDEESEAVLTVHLLRSVADVVPGGLERMHAAITDEAQPGRLVQQPQDENGIFLHELAQPQAFCL
jgi:hypothetical protein